ncbi:MAG: MopE-related protein [Myxococcota bacterium]|jgi:hypothetical protein|nr:MopE-related protein [Myxococcota bacterium]
MRAIGLRVIFGIALVAGCGDDAPPVDVDGAVTCTASSQCDDGVYCNGAERCMPGAADADLLGCVAGPLPCEGGATCNESADACLEDCPDADGDGSPDARCGGDDCDDADPERHPGATEVCDPEGFDEDCDPTTVGDRDVDGDGHASDRCCNGDTCSLDCDDARRGTNPSVPEVCDGLDNDCDGVVDEGLLIELFRDADHDGVGIREATALACPGAPGFASAAGDCDDTRASVRPTAPEICDELDNDCDGVIDESTVAVPWYLDGDGDGWGIVNADALPVDSCVPPEGRAIRIGDCNDDNADIAPTAREQCNAIDDDCDGRPDYQIGTRDFEDDDGDGVPDAACGLELADCDDRDPTIAPGVLELCDLFDNDCDGVTDEDAAERDWFGDMDGDGYGDASSVVRSCAIVSGRTLDDSDCDDLNSSTNPGRSDACGGQVSVDDDCDGEVDEGGNALTFYADLDGDGYGSGDAIVACQGDAQTATRGGDCDDTDARVNPGQLDDCAALSEVDDDCDGRVDETLTPRVFYVDGDGDGYGAGAPSEGCVQPVGTSVLGGDCDDTNASRNPGVPDDCGTALGVDDDCDVSVDEDVVPRTFYVDRDGDGYGAGPASMACVVPAGSVTTAGDCDDASVARNPAAPDDCTRTPLVDDDCDGRVDEAATLTSWYRDTDGDGYGSGAAVVACTAPTNHVNRAGDCDESRVAVNPGAADDCTGLSGVNDDCDASTDEAVMLIAWYPDADGDGYGTGSAVLACTAPAGHASRTGDCNDGASNQSPGRADDCTTTIGNDDDCDGRVDEGATLTTWYRDADGDGFGNASVSMQACTRPTGFVADATDCNDAAATAFPQASEATCNDLLDNDCDGAIDCSDSNCSAGCPVLRVVSGGGQSAPLHMPFAAPLVVAVEDRLGTPLSGRAVYLTTRGVNVGALYGSIGYSQSSDVMGQTSFAIRAGLGLGVETVTLSSPGAVSIDVPLTGTTPARGTIFTLLNGARISTAGGIPGPARDVRGTSNVGAVTTLFDGGLAFAINNTVLRVFPDGRTERVLGGGSVAPTDGALATTVSFGSLGAAIGGDPMRPRLYFERGCSVWYVDLTLGTVHPFAGTGTCGYTGDDGPALSANIRAIVDMAVSDSGLVYFSTDTSAPDPRPIRVVDTSGTIRTFVAASYASPPYEIFNFSLYMSPVPGSEDVVVVAQVSNAGYVGARPAVLRVRPDRSFTVLAGTGTDATGEGIPATTASIDGHFVAAFEDGSVVLADASSDRLRVISGGTITTIAGTRGMGGYAGDGTPASTALIDAPGSIVTWRDDHVVFVQAGTLRAVRR